MREGWWWYKFETPIGIHHIPVYVEMDSDGQFYASEVSVEDYEFLGYVDELEGNLVKFIGEAPYWESN